MKPTHNRMTPYHSPQAQPLTIYCQVCGSRLSDAEFARGSTCGACKLSLAILADEMSGPITAGGQGNDAGDVQQSSGNLVMVLVGAFGALFSGLAFIGACWVVRWMMGGAM